MQARKLVTYGQQVSISRINKNKSTYSKITSSMCELQALKTKQHSTCAACHSGKQEKTIAAFWGDQNNQSVQPAAAASKK